MNSAHKPLIVVVAYNRPKSLERMLSSLSLIKTTKQPELLISIDNAGAASEAVKTLADNYDWPWKKHVTLHPDRKGLKNHILWCAAKSQTYGSVIILEDDLIVSPNFYDGACQMLDAYSSDPQIAGISLYTYNFNESAHLPWHRIKGNGDVHLMQQVSSWGQAWTRTQWEAFETWYSNDQPNELHPSIPSNIRSWPDSSWKKHFIDYVTHKGLSIVYPDDSLTSNSGDPGTHFNKKYNLFRVPLTISNTPLNCPSIEDVDIRYDLHHELLPEVFKRKNKALLNYDFDVDFYGSKNHTDTQYEFLLTNRACDNPILTWGLELEPIELNVLLNIKGSGINLARKTDVQQLDEDRLQRYIYLDKTPVWVHDALGKPLSTRIELALKTATSSSLTNKLLESIFKLFNRS